MFESSDPGRIVCVNFSAEEIDALRSLLGLLEPYLKRAWLVEGGSSGSVYFVNADACAEAEIPQDIRRTPAIFFALRPRLHCKGTLHRPLRASEVLAVLSEISIDAAKLAGPRSARNGVEWQFRLRSWPFDLDKWPRDWWRVLACTTGSARSVADIADRVGLASDEVDRCIAAFVSAGLMDRLAIRRADENPRVGVSPARWRGLATRVGQLLGFA